MTEQQVMKMALEVLEIAADGGGVNFYEYAKELRQALEQQPADEPVAWWNDTGTHIDLNVSGRGKPLYTRPQQKNERYFCERCGKRLFDGIHTCTPPADTLQENT